MKEGDIVRVTGSSGEQYRIVRIFSNGEADVSDGVTTIRVPLSDLTSMGKKYSSILMFDNRDEMEKHMDDMIASASAGLAEMLSHVDERAQEEIDAEQINWFGEPFPRSIEEIKARNTFQNKDRYNEIKAKTQDSLKQLVMNSIANVLSPKMVYNDRELGEFDFNKASVYLVPAVQFYNLKTKDYVTSDKLQGASRQIKRDGKDTVLYFYKELNTGNDVVAVPYFTLKAEDKKEEKKILHKAYTEIFNGDDVHAVAAKHNLKFSKLNSMVKKSYLYKQKLPKPKNAVRLFVLTGANANYTWEQLLYSGMTASIVTEYLSMMGYAVNIICGIGVGRHDLNNTKKETVPGTRYLLFNLKRFDETVDVMTMLYVLSDPTFFRYKCFRYFHCLSEKYEDSFQPSIGFMAGHNDFKQGMFQTFIPRDTLNKSCMYYFFSNIYSQNDMMAAIRDTILSCENENKKMRADIGLAEFAEADQLKD